jgi:hypothetical protein
LNGGLGTPIPFPLFDNNRLIIRASSRQAHQEENQVNSHSIRVAALAVFFLSTSVLFVAAQDHSMNMKQHQLTQKQVKALIVSAKTSEDHMRLASYFRGEAQREQASAKTHEEMANLYDPKTEMAKHCKNLSEELRKAGESASSMATEHEKMAASTRE